MQKRDYANLQEEQSAEMGTYEGNIPVGQPVGTPMGQQMGQPMPQHQPVMMNQMGQPIMGHHAPHGNAPIYPPPPPGGMVVMQPMQPMQQMQMASPPPPMINNQNFDYPSTLTCHCCKQAVHTIVSKQPGNTTFLWCAFVFLCVSPCCSCLPFLFDSCLDKSHYCPNCGHNILRKHQKCFEFTGC